MAKVGARSVVALTIYAARNYLVEV
jgi:hypothetical protein